MSHHPLRSAYVVTAEDEDKSWKLRQNFLKKYPKTICSLQVTVIIIHDTLSSLIFRVKKYYNCNKNYTIKVLYPYYCA